jgi:hypothetical protein
VSNVKSQTITTPTVGNLTGFTATQNYAYDSLNRIKQAEETIPSQIGWKQTFKYDRYGNREFDTQNNNTTTLANGCPVAICNPSANPQDNKLVGTNYDSVGNTKIDANGQTMTLKTNKFKLIMQAELSVNTSTMAMANALRNMFLQQVKQLSLYMTLVVKWSQSIQRLRLRKQKPRLVI